MAGAVETVRLSEFGPWAARLGDRAGRIHWPPAFKIIRVLLAADAQRHFATGRGPDGVAWKPLKSPSARRGGRTAKPLRNTGLLMGSLAAAGGAGHVEEVTRTSLAWGTGVDYAGFHQDGTRHIPARPFLGWSPGLLRQVEQALAEHAARALVEG